MSGISKQNIVELKYIIKDINKYQKQIDILLEYLYRNANKPEFVKNKIITINDLNEGLRIKYDNLLKLCISLYYKN